MLLNVQTVLRLIAFGLTLMSGISGRVPVWIPVLLVTIALLLTAVR